MAEVSVIIPTRGRSHLLPRALRSVLCQTFQDFEVILVDDNDDSARLKLFPELNDFFAIPSIRVIENPRPTNAAAARNLGLRTARGEWITYLDDDDIYLPQKLEKQLLLAKKTGTKMVLCGLEYQLMWRRKKSQVATSKFEGSELLTRVIPQTPAFFHFNDHNTFFLSESNVRQDVFFFYNYLHTNRIDRVYNVPEPLVRIFPDPVPRHLKNSSHAWAAERRIYLQFIRGYPKNAARIFLLRSLFSRCKYRSGNLIRMLKISFRLVQLGGFRELRAIINGLLYRIPLLRKFLVT